MAFGRGFKREKGKKYNNTKVEYDGIKFDSKKCDKNHKKIQRAIYYFMKRKRFTKIRRIYNVKT